MNPIVHKIISKSTSEKEVICSIHSEDGMRKEAIVLDITGEKWCMICDEGPYLDGADSAPPPLAYFSAGMAFGFVSQLNLLAEEFGVLIEDYKIIQDNYYTIEGSAIKKTMVSGGLPVDVKVELKSNADKKKLEKLIELTKAQNPVYAYLETNLKNHFSLFHNGVKLNVQQKGDVQTLPTLDLEKDYSIGQDLNKEEAIVSKQEQVETLFDVEGGKGSALKETQKRNLHIRAITTPHKDGISKTQVQIFKPIGSMFQFFCDLPNRIGGELRTPSALAYASAGIGFCFMTQIGRYAKIKKYNLNNYSINQKTSFSIEPGISKVFPLTTDTYIDSTLSDHIAQEVFTMSEQTCFLHGAMKEEHKTNFEVILIE